MWTKKDPQKLSLRNKFFVRTKKITHKQEQLRFISIFKGTEEKSNSLRGEQQHQDPNNRVIQRKWAAPFAEQSSGAAFLSSLLPFSQTLSVEGMKKWKTRASREPPPRFLLVTLPVYFHIPCLPTCDYRLTVYVLQRQQGLILLSGSHLSFYQSRINMVNWPQPSPHASFIFIKDYFYQLA